MLWSLKLDFNLLQRHVSWKSIVLTGRGTTLSEFSETSIASFVKYCQLAQFFSDNILIACTVRDYNPCFNSYNMSYTRSRIGLNYWDSNPGPSALSCCLVARLLLWLSDTRLFYLQGIQDTHDCLYEYPRLSESTS